MEFTIYNLQFRKKSILNFFSREIPSLKIVNCKLKIDQVGISLVELLIGIATAGIVGALLVALLTQNSQIFNNQNAKLTEGITLNDAVSNVERSIKSASGVVTKYPVSGAAQYTTGQNTLVMSVPSLNAQGSIIDDVYDYLIIAADQQNSKILRLRFIPDASSTREARNEVLATTLSEIRFSYLDSNEQNITPIQAVKVGYIINLSQNVNSQSQQASASGQINLRNN